jgi:hypothetical protein
MEKQYRRPMFGFLPRTWREFWFLNAFLIAGGFVSSILVRVSGFYAWLPLP